jgi:hypothetical protein
VSKLLPLLRSAVLNGSAEGLSCARACPLLLTRGFADDAQLLKTPLYDFHVEHGGTHPVQVLIMTALIRTDERHGHHRDVQGSCKAHL